MIIVKIVVIMIIAKYNITSKDIITNYPVTAISVLYIETSRGNSEKNDVPFEQ